MRISPILTNSFYNFSKTQVQQKPNDNNIKRDYKLPNYAHYMSFTGGSSLNLKESVVNLDALSSVQGEKFPPEVHSEALEIIRNGNPEGKTLIDIHKNRYSLLNDCYDLDDAKALFEEFKGVLSDSQVDYMPDSFIAKVKNGEIENFNKDEDLAFQLLKLYWAEGFSLNDLKEYSGVNLYHTLNKFNIPLMDRDYAHVLKFSDKEYNERLTKQMAQKRMESMDRKVQEKEGEPVYIPRGPLSESHRKHISEGLIKHYAEHPEKMALMSQRQKKYFEDNPEQVLLFKNAVTHAWNNTQEGRSLKKHITKFFKKHKAVMDENVLGCDFEKMTKTQQELFGDFWKKNHWAREQFSAAMKKGWEAVKTFTAPSYDKYSNPYLAPLIDVVPKKYVRDVQDWCIRNSINTKGIDFNTVNTPDADSEVCRKFLELNKAYVIANPGAPDTITSALTAAVLSIRNDIVSGKLPNNVAHNKDFLCAVVINIDDLYYPDNSILSPYNMKNPKITSYDEVYSLINLLGRIAALHKQEYFLSYVEDKINTSYDLLTSVKTEYDRQKFLDFIGI